MGGLSSIGRTSDAHSAPVFRVGNTRSQRPPLARACREHETARHPSCRMSTRDCKADASTILHLLIHAHAPGGDIDLPAVFGPRDPVEIIGRRFVLHR